MSVRKRIWSVNGERREAWVADYVDQGGERHIKTFAKRRDAESFHASVSVEVAKGLHTADRRSPPHRWWSDSTTWTASAAMAGGRWSSAITHMLVASGTSVTAETSAIPAMPGVGSSRYSTMPESRSATLIEVKRSEGAQRVALETPAPHFAGDGERLLEVIARLLGPTRVFAQEPQVVKHDAFESAVPDFASDGERLLVLDTCLVHPALRVV